MTLRLWIKCEGRRRGIASLNERPFLVVKILRLCVFQPRWNVFCGDKPDSSLEVDHDRSWCSRAICGANGAVKIGFCISGATAAHFRWTLSVRQCSSTIPIRFWPIGRMISVSSLFLFLRARLCPAVLQILQFVLIVGALQLFHGLLRAGFFVRQLRCHIGFQDVNLPS